MSRVYRVGSLYGTEYFNTAREAGRCKPGGEEPERVTVIDAAAECNRLDRQLDESERTIHRLRVMLENLLDVSYPATVAGTAAGRRAQKFVTDNPLPPATSADRDGQRSYGGG